MTLSTGLTHLLILIHGLHGKPQDWEYYRKHLDLPSCVVFIPNFAPWSIETHYGVDWCATKILEMITSNSFEGADQLSRDYRISIFGHSLGGVIGRYLIGLLYANDFFNIHPPINFVTFSSPHLGSLDYNFLFQSVGSLAGGATGNQMFLRDQKEEPLLVQLTKPESVYIAALKLFQKRTLYSNIKGDLQVGFCTSAIMSLNPYAEMLNTLKTKEECLILGDLTEPHNMDSFRNDPNFFVDLMPNSKSTSSEQNQERTKHLEEMIQNLNSLLWRRVDVWFSFSVRPFYINPHASIIIHSDWSVYHFARPVFDHVVREHEFD